MTCPFRSSFSHENYRFDSNESDRKKREIIWEVKNTRPFTELILSWNGLRPIKGNWRFLVRLWKNQSGSPWLPYAEWGSGLQKTFKSAPPDSFAETHQDAAIAKEGFCDGFTAKISAEEGADLQRFDSLYASLFNSSSSLFPETIRLSPVFLKDVPLQSQMTLPHPRHRDLCSPISASNAVNFLAGYKKADPVRFAESIRDLGFDIYGNWILNTAEAYCLLEGGYRTWVERLPHFGIVHEELVRGNPVVVSVKGSIPGAPQPYPFGHLICVTGYDPKEGRVHCVDPAFPSDASTQTSYALSDFIAAWGARKNLAYLFEKKKIISS